VLSKKRAPVVADPNISKVLNKLYDDLNELIDAVNSIGDSASSIIKGKTGDSRVVKKADGNMTYQIRTEHGWSEPDGVTYKLVDSE